MAWDGGLSEEQRTAAGHIGTNARLLAGPGTGKTRCLTRRVWFLVEQRNTAPGQILLLTFTRAAAHELRMRLKAELGPDRLPRISTIHSFALRQLLRNAARLNTLPQPLRIADDWEERQIILEDLKSLVGLDRIEDTRELLNQLSADWQSLTVDEADWEARFPNPKFIGAWQEHRVAYGYTLRAELVYQLKRALEQAGDFALEGPPLNLLIDEYQDLNRCDLSVVRAMADRGAEIYVAGDDDQSIYGFRKAHPEGIRRFPLEYEGAADLSLSLCKRCDGGILEFGLFVARQDYSRLEKPLKPEDGRGPGEIALLRFRDQDAEAEGVAGLALYLLLRHKLEPHKVLVLLRTDRNGVFSTKLREYLSRNEVPVSVGTADMSVFNERSGRLALAILRMIASANDHLSWRTLLELRRNQIGPGGIRSLYDLSRQSGIGLAQTIARAIENPSILPSSHRNRLQTEIRAIGELLVTSTPKGEESVMATIRRVADAVAEGDANRVIAEFSRIPDVSDGSSLTDVLRMVEASSVDIEQEIEHGKVNILTMHKAKGLTAKAVIVVAAEDEYLPGRAIGDAVGDERRLLYVSLTRAMHHLFITHCDRRTGAQRHTGRTSGIAQRTLSRFLRDGPIPSKDGAVHVASLLEIVN